MSYVRCFPPATGVFPHWSSPGDAKVTPRYPPTFLDASVLGDRAPTIKSVVVGVIGSATPCAPGVITTVGGTTL